MLLQSTSSLLFCTFFNNLTLRCHVAKCFLFGPCKSTSPSTFRFSARNITNGNILNEFVRLQIYSNISNVWTFHNRLSPIITGKSKGRTRVKILSGDCPRFRKFRKFFFRGKRAKALTYKNIFKETTLKFWQTVSLSNLSWLTGTEIYHKSWNL